MNLIINPQVENPVIITLREDKTNSVTVLANGQAVVVLKGDGRLYLPMASPRGLEEMGFQIKEDRVLCFDVTQNTI